MVSFRFHLISLVAVFMALGIGIAVGASAVREGTVQGLTDRLNTAKKDQAEQNRLSTDVGRWETYADRSRLKLIEGQLTGVPVLVVAVNGVDRQRIKDLRADLAAAGARLEGTIWFTAKMQLDPKRPDDLQSLAAIFELSPNDPPDTIRQEATTKLATEWATGSAPPTAALLRAGFLEFEAEPQSTLDIGKLPLAGTRFVVASQAEAVVPNEQLMVPFVSALAGGAPAHVLAVEAGRAASGKDPGSRAAFVGPLRVDATVANELSTVDDIEDPRGRVAAIFALQDLTASGAIGHYGVGPRATFLPPRLGAG